MSEKERITYFEDGYITPLAYEITGLIPRVGDHVQMPDTQGNSNTYKVLRVYRQMSALCPTDSGNNTYMNEISVMMENTYYAR